ncbi:MAG TPA: gamma carbonic anhydrase family protein [Burkholderiales bacterium]|jgi:carbonic anhydrase/acetyltransferase-like protein (isoleucine patch superfamily)|nr:gamma carbonic anhydrase family protein [Burkholderiales bacterium]
MKFSLGDRKIITHGDHYIAGNAVVIGSVVLGHNASVWFGSIIRGDNDVITIGDESNIQDGCVLHTDEGVKLTLERRVSVGHMVMLHGCTIGEGSLIGIKSVILNHARVGRHCLIGANTLIAENKVIPDGSLVLGSPGRVVRQLTADEIKMIDGIADHYVENGKRFLRELKRDD